MMWELAIWFCVGWMCCSAVHFARRQSLLDRIRLLESDKEDVEAELFHRVMVDRQHKALSTVDMLRKRQNLN